MFRRGSTLQMSRTRREKSFKTNEFAINVISLEVKCRAKDCHRIFLRRLKTTVIVMSEFDKSSGTNKFD